MSLSDLAALGNFISGIAVLFSFVFLALQMRQSSISQKAIVHQNRTARTADMLFHTMKHWPVLSKVSIGTGALNGDEYFEFVSVCSAALWNLEDSFYQHQIGLLDDGAFEAVSRRFRRNFTNPGLRAVWYQRRPEYHPVFAQYCDRIASEAAQTPARNDLEDFKRLLAREVALQNQTILPS